MTPGLGLGDLDPRMLRPASPAAVFEGNVLVSKISAIARGKLAHLPKIFAFIFSMPAPSAPPSREGPRDGAGTHSI